MLPPEVEEGNHEYKRFFKNIQKKRFIELSTQMAWRLEEGDGIAYYYIGVNDDGNIYDKLTNKQIKYSMKILNSIVDRCKAKITKIENNIEEEKRWFKIEIKVFECINNYKEVRILLLGDTDTGKSTFIANLIKNKLDINGNAKNYVYNHKHELVSGNTSSINYYPLIFDNTKYLFFDTPGNKRYIKTLLKMIQSIDYNLVLYFPNFDERTWEYEKLFYQYFEMRKIPIKLVNIYKKLPILNNDFTYDINELIKKNDLIKKINSFKIEDDSCSHNLKFNILQTCYNNELGWLLSGFLKSGKMNVGDELFWYSFVKLKVKILSLHDSISSRISINEKRTFTICIKILDNNDFIDSSNLKYGFISNKSNIKIRSNLNIDWLENIKTDLQLLCNVENNKIILEKKKEKYNIINNKVYLTDNIIICFCQKQIGLIRP